MNPNQENEIREYLYENYDIDFLEQFNIIYGKGSSKEEKNKINILIDFESEFQDLVINKNIYVIHSYIELKSVIDFFLNNKKFIG